MEASLVCYQVKASDFPFSNSLNAMEVVIVYQYAVMHKILITRFTASINRHNQAG